MAGLIMIVSLALLALLAPAITPYDPIRPSTSEVLRPPSFAHPMGTDELGRDLLSRVLFGGRTTLAVGIVPVLLAVTVGVPTGLLAAYRRGRVDMVVMRVIDILLALPGILLALAIVGMLGPGLGNVMLAVGIAAIPSYARIVRASGLSVRAMPYIEAACAVGCRGDRIVLRHILPNVLAPVIVLATLGTAGAILAAAALSFIGLGAQPPEPEWGAMIGGSRSYLRIAWWMPTFPGLAIMTAVLGINLIGDGLRDALDPRLR